MSNDETKQKVWRKRQRNLIAKQLRTDPQYRQKIKPKKKVEEERFRAYDVYRGLTDNE